MPLTKLRRHLACGEYLQARREAERLIRLGEAAGEDLVEAYRGAALAYYHLQDIYAAVKLGERALELAQGLGTGESIGKIRYDLGEYYLRLGDYHLAYDQFVQFLSDLHLYPSLSTYEAWAQHNLALILRYQRRYQDALAVHHLAVELHRRNGDLSRTMEALRGVAWCYLTQGDPESAWPCLQQISACLRHHPDERMAASLLTDLAYYYQQIGDFKSSMDYCAEAMVPGRPGVDDHVLATACVIAGENAVALERWQEARIFANLAQEYAFRAWHPALMNRTAALQRQLREAGAPTSVDH